MTIRFLQALIIILAIFVVIGYATWRSLNYARGPEIDIFFPQDWHTATTSTISIFGRVQRVNDLYLNGKAITVNEQGNFNEKIIVFPGVNIITFDAHDRFERETSKQLKIVGF